jgi:hypothetical protein
MTDSPAIVLQWGDGRALDAAVTSVASAGSGRAAIVLHAGADDRWLRLDAPELFADWAAQVAAALPDERRWTTIDGLNDWPVTAYAGNLRGLATGHLLRALDHQLAGHALASAALPHGSDVAVGLADDDAYELGQLLLDVLAAPRLGVARNAIGPHLRARRQDYVRGHAAVSPRRRLRRRLVASAIPLEQALPRAIAAAYATALEPA